MVIVNAVVLTMDDLVLKNGYVEIKDGVITAVGEMTDNVDFKDSYDAKGCYVVPGLIDAHTHLGMNVDKKFESPINYDFYAIDNVNFNDIYFKRAYENGVVYVGISPVSRCPVGGIVSVVNTKTGKVIKKDVALKLSTGENPMKEFSMTEDEVLEIVKEAIKKSDLPVHVHAHKMNKALTDVILVHGTDAKTGQIMAGPMLTDISKEEMKNLSYENLYNQYKNGAEIAITSDHPETPCDYLLLYAQLAAKYGVNFDDALKMITVNPAKVLGIKAGKIKVGYLGEVLLFDKHPIDFYSKLIKVF